MTTDRTDTAVPPLVQTHLGRCLTLLVVFALSGAGCVTTAKYRADLDASERVLKDRDKAARDRQTALEAEVAARGRDVTDLQKRLLDLTAERDALAKKLDEMTALSGELKKRLEKLGQNVDRLSSEKGQLAETLADAKTRLEELRKQKAAAEARAATFRQLVSRLRSMIDAGQLKVIIRDGRMLIALPNDVLFDSGKTAVKPAGQAAIAKVASALAPITDRRFLVVGHTDDVPIHTARFPSNWELSTARAVEVVKILLANGLSAKSLGAGGRADADPVQPNDAADHRAQNRRIEIVLEPNLSDLPNLDGLNAP